MENQINIQKGWRTREQKQEIIQQWQQSGKSRKQFCEETGIGYNSLVGWCKQFKENEERLSGFSELKIESATGIVAQVRFPSGVRIDFYQPITSEFIRSFI